MTEEQTAIVKRLCTLLQDETVQREVPMFGGIAFMVNEKMIVSVGKHGGLLVRVDGARHDELIGRAGAAQAEMGAGRTMGPGWIAVDASGIEDEESLAFWVRTALEDNRSVTGGRV